MFNESESGESFYYCNDGTVDLTSSLQRQHQPQYDSKAPLWQRADDRFFWNKHMVADMMEGQVSKVSNHPHLVQGSPQCLPVGHCDSRVALFLTSLGRDNGLYIRADLYYSGPQYFNIFVFQITNVVVTLIYGGLFPVLASCIIL